MSTQPLPNLVPPFTRETAIAKVRKAEDGWNSRDPEKVALGLHRGQQMAQPRRVRQRTRRDHQVPHQKVASRARLSPHQRTVGLRRRTNRRALRLRMPRRLRQLVPLLRKRKLGVRRLPASCITAMPASTTCRSKSRSANSTGPSAADPTITPASLTWACNSEKWRATRIR